MEVVRVFLRMEKRRLTSFVFRGEIIKKSSLRNARRRVRTPHRSSVDKTSAARVQTDLLETEHRGLMLMQTVQVPEFVQVVDNAREGYSPRQRETRLS